MNSITPSLRQAVKWLSYYTSPSFIRKRGISNPLTDPVNTCHPEVVEI